MKISILIVYSLALIFILGGCGESPNCGCLADEIDYIKELQEDGEIALAPSLKSKSCKYLNGEITGEPMDRWLQFTERVSSCSKFQEYSELHAAGMQQVMPDSEADRVTW